MIQKLKAREVNFVEEEFDGAYPNVVTVGFAENAETSNTPDFGAYFLMQRCVEEEPDGDDDVYCEWCDQGGGGYGGIKSFTLNRSSVRVEFESDAKLFEMFDEEDKFGILEISFEIDDRKFNAIRDKLKNVIFRDCDLYFEK